MPHPEVIHGNPSKQRIVFRRDHRRQRRPPPSGFRGINRGERFVVGLAVAVADQFDGRDQRGLLGGELPDEFVDLRFGSLEGIDRLPLDEQFFTRISQQLPRIVNRDAGRSGCCCPLGDQYQSRQFGRIRRRWLREPGQVCGAGHWQRCVRMTRLRGDQLGSFDRGARLCDALPHERFPLGRGLRRHRCRRLLDRVCQHRIRGQRFQSKLVERRDGGVREQTHAPPLRPRAGQREGNRQLVVDPDIDQLIADQHGQAIVGPESHRAGLHRPHGVNILAVFPQIKLDLPATHAQEQPCPGVACPIIVEGDPGRLPHRTAIDLHPHRQFKVSGRVLV